MVDAIKSYWTYGTTFCSIEVTTIEGAAKAFAVTARKRNGEFKEFDFVEESTFADLSKVLPKNQHSYLTINTEKVLIKEIPLNSNNHKALTQAFPGVSPNDFYYEILRSGMKCFIAVCRKDEVQAIVKEAEKEKISVIGIRLGFSGLMQLTPFFREDVISLARFDIQLDKEYILSFGNRMHELKSYQIEDIQVHASYIIALAGMFDYVSANNSSASNFTEENNNHKKRYGEKNFFRKGSLAAIGILLVLFIINFFFFNAYFEQQQLSQEEVQLSASKKESYTKNVLLISAKERIVSNVLNSDNSKSTFYINRIVVSKPATVLFTELQFQPLVKSIRPDKIIIYESNRINLSGESSNKIDFSKWIEELEQFEWIEGVTVTHYNSASKLASFGINILVQNDTEE